MWEGVAAGLLIHLGKGLIDKFWGERRAGKLPVIDQSGDFGYMGLDEGRMVVGSDFTVAEGQEYELLFGDIYLPDTIAEWMEGDEILLVLIMDESSSQVYLFEADLEEGYAIYLPHGFYSCYVFLMDPEADDLFNAEIYAVGLPPCEGIDLSEIDGFSLEDEQDIFDIVDDSPIAITPGGPFYLDIILIDTASVPEFPKYFSEFAA